MRTPLAAHQLSNSMSSVSVKKFQPPISSSSARVKPKPVPLTAQVVPSIMRAALRCTESCRYHSAYADEIQLSPKFFVLR